ncbi:MAG TPA: hypothetical protein VGM86_00335 [Thermoanaerobaculia bacterium]|jgi:hypothetical protein
MRKGKKDKRPRVAEIVSLNEELFSLVNGDPLTTIDQHIELVIAAAGNFICDTFTCGTYSGVCSSFACGTFKMKPA